MTKKTSATGLRHSPPEDEGDPQAKELCRQAPIAQSSTHIPEGAELAITNLPRTPSTPESGVQTPLRHMPPIPSPAGSGIPNAVSLLTEKVSCDPLHPQGHRTSSEHLGHNLPPFLSFLKSTLPRKTCSDSSPKAMGGRTASQVDPGVAYDNMILGYFTPSSQAQQGVKTSTPLSCRQAVSGKLRSVGSSQTSSYLHNIQPNPLQVINLDLLPSPPNSNSSLGEPSTDAVQESLTENFPLDEISGDFTENQVVESSVSSGRNARNAATQVSLGVTASGCTLLSEGTMNMGLNPAFNEYIVSSEPSAVTKSSGFVDSRMGRTDGILLEHAGPSGSGYHGGLQASGAVPASQGFDYVYDTGTQFPSAMSSVFMSPQGSRGTAHFPNENFPTTFVPAADHSGNCSEDPEKARYKDGFQEIKSVSSLGRYPVLPPVMNNAPSEGDNVSTMSYNSSNSSAQVFPPSMYYTSFSPFADFHSSALAGSPRTSGRSSFSGRGSRKRALSNSPLSSEGIDLNTIIRMSPTSLLTYLTSSRSSSSCVSPGSTGEKAGCYGHLSARNSSSSPHSGSGSSGARRSSSHTPKSAMATIPSHVRDFGNAGACSRTSADNSYKPDIFDIDNNLLVLQAMQELEASCTVSANDNFITGNSDVQFPSMVPECDNLRILPQDMAMYRLDEYLPFASVNNYTLPVNHPCIPQQQQPQQPRQHQPPQHQPPRPQQQQQPSQQQQHSQQQPPPPPPPSQLAVYPSTETTKSLLPPLPNKPPPSYDQHMARKAMLQKKSSSDSSQPSNSTSSSFESSEGDKTCGGHSSSTDSDHNRMYECRWLECKSVFQDHEEFVNHVDKQHIEQRKGEEFVCYWENCPRKLQPFNARYKLVVHTRVHTGDKPNKCTYTGCKKAFSRLENLKIHMRSHTGERPYSCLHQGCPKTFSNSSDRAKHQKTHQDTRPYVCQVPGCGKRYTDPSSLRKHAKSSHGEKKETGRKKIRGGIEELDPKDLSECLIIQPLKPKPQHDVSPPEPTDSGLGRSPRASHLGYCSDHHAGFGASGDTSSSRSGTGLGSSNQTSPSSHHSSPRTLNDPGERYTSSNVSTLPPIASAQSRISSAGKQQPQSTRSRPPSLAASRSGGSVSSASSKGSTTKISLSGMTRDLIADQNPLLSGSCSSMNMRCYSASARRNLLPDALMDATPRFDAT